MSYLAYDAFRRKVCFRYKRAVLVLLGVLDVLEFLGYPGEKCGGIVV